MKKASRGSTGSLRPIVMSVARAKRGDSLAQAAYRHHHGTHSHPPRSGHPHRSAGDTRRLQRNGLVQIAIVAALFKLLKRKVELHFIV